MVVDPPGSPPSYRDCFRMRRSAGKSSEIGTGDILDSLERFHRSRSIIEDFTSRTLAVIPGDFCRLCYIGSLRDPETGRYRHDGLADIYSDHSVQEALGHCQEEIFSRILEAPLSYQQRELSNWLECAGEQFWNVAETWKDGSGLQAMCPEGAPGYLIELFWSNTKVLLAILSAKQGYLGLAS
jgi:hypothetical protein